MNSANLVQSGMWTLILESGPVAKFILLLLSVCSVFTWAIIVTKWRVIKRASRENVKFLETFWGGKNLEEVFTKSDKFTASPIAAIFRSGVKELKRLSDDASRPLTSDGIENVNRALLRASNQEISAFESHIGWLATVASGAPFVGLFGTVWGIMYSFQRIGAEGAANLAVVAPGIAEALIATAFGIGAAVPAVVGYNHFAGLIKRQAVDLECFTQDFLNIVQRGLSGTIPGKGQ